MYPCTNVSLAVIQRRRQQNLPVMEHILRFKHLMSNLSDLGHFEFNLSQLNDTWPGWMHGLPTPTTVGPKPGTNSSAVSSLLYSQLRLDFVDGIDQHHLWRMQAEADLTTRSSFTLSEMSTDLLIAYWETIKSACQRNRFVYFTEPFKKINGQSDTSLGHISFYSLLDGTDLYTRK